MNISNVVLDRDKKIVTYNAPIGGQIEMNVYLDNGSGNWIVLGDALWTSEVNEMLRAIPKPEQVKQERYLKEDGTDTIDKWAATRTHEVFRELMWAMMEKYKDRLGKKDPIPQEVGKMADYMNRWVEYEKIWAKEDAE